MSATMTMSDRTAVVIAKYEETSLRDAGKPYSEAVIACCDLFLNCFPLTERARIEMSLARDD
jgi:hypothetical protein